MEREREREIHGIGIAFYKNCTFCIFFIPIIYIHGIAFCKNHYFHVINKVSKIPKTLSLLSACLSLATTSSPSLLSPCWSENREDLEKTVKPEIDIYIYIYIVSLQTIYVLYILNTHTKFHTKWTFNLQTHILCIILKYKNLKFKIFKEEMIVDLKSSWNFESMECIRRKFNSM